MLVFPVCSHSNGRQHVLLWLFEKGCDTVGADFTSIHQTTTTNINDITTFMRLLKLDKLHLSSEIKTFEALCSYKTNTDLSFRSCTAISIEYYFMSRPQPIYTTTTITLSYYMHLPLLSMFPVAIVHRPTLVRTKDDYEASRVCFCCCYCAASITVIRWTGWFTAPSGYLKISEWPSCVEKLI